MSIPIEYSFLIALMKKIQTGYMLSSAFITTAPKSKLVLSEPYSVALGQAFIGDNGNSTFSTVSRYLIFFRESFQKLWQF